jgi:hypothetical protein
MAAARPAWAVLIVALLSPAARADPIFAPPDIGAGALAGNEHERGSFGLLAELSTWVMADGERVGTFADIGDGSGGDTWLSLRVGFAGETCWPLGYAVRVDASEARRVDGDAARDEPIAAVSQFVDDAWVWWRPHVAAQLIAGRFHVPFARSRQWDRSELTAGVAPFAIRRASPERRWGLTFLGDLGALSYAAGAYADTDAVEPRLSIGSPAGSLTVDPSAHGRAAFGVHGEWTPRAPIRRGSLAPPSSDPWFDWVRVSAGAGVLVRVRERGRGTRTDLTLSGNLKWKRLSIAAELLFAVEPDAFESAASGELGWGVTDRGAVFARGEYERCDPRDSAKLACDLAPHTSAGLHDALYTAGGGASYFVSADRRSRITVFGFRRREVGAELDAGGAIVQLQTAL